MAIPIRIIWIVLMPAKVAEVFFCLTTYQHQRTFQNKCLPSSWSVYFHRIQSRTSIFCQTLPRIPKNLLTHFKALDWRVFISTEFKVQSRYFHFRQILIIVKEKNLLTHFKAVKGVGKLFQLKYILVLITWCEEGREEETHGQFIVCEVSIGTD